MNQIKGSLPVKAFVHIVLFLSGLIICIGSYYIFTYLDSYSTTISDFTQTSEFQNKYLKYVERVAVYIAYREEGYSGSLGYDNSIDLSTLLEADTGKTSTPKSTSNQEDFDYYNAILNHTNTNFLYYVKNLTTGTVYCSPSLESTLGSKSGSKDTQNTLDDYIKNIQSNSAYLILNTQTERYATNVNRNYQFLNDENLSWVMDYIAGSGSNELALSYDERSGYILCTSIMESFPNSEDEFGILYNHYMQMHRNYTLALYPVPIAFLFFVLFFCLTIACSGHKKGIEGIRLNKFDHLFTEIGLGIIVAGIWILLLLGLDFTRVIRSEFHLKKYYILIMAYTLMYPYCLFGFLSLVRRFKANTVLHNSLLYLGCKKLFTFLKNSYAQRNITFRVAVLLILFAGIQMIGFYLSNIFDRNGNSNLFIIIMLLDYMFLGSVLFKVAMDYSILRDETKKLTEGDLNHKIPVYNMCDQARTLGEYINNIGDGFSAAIDEKLKSERLKTELITNVSHDIKTPLTSIINYVDLLKKENLNNEIAAGYLDVLSSKSWRLKTLIEDLVEASKASSGTLALNLESLNLVELIRQSLGEFEDRFISHNLETILTITEEPIYIMADGRSTYRIIENIFSNVNKYALSGTRVYVDITTENDSVTVSVKNISANKLNMNSEDLLERFVRGDIARNTEGSGLGLSIARSLASLQNAYFDIILDGDLFKAMVKFNRIKQPIKSSVIDEQMKDEPID